METRVIRILTPLAAALLLVCLGPRPAETAPETAAATPTAAPAAGALLWAACPAITEAEAAAGRSIFTGAGNCYTCHGPDAKGTPLAPDLHQHKWVDISGSYESIDSLVIAGVAHPKAHPAPMPPKGGANLNAAQICDVAAYVYSISHPKAAQSGSKPSS